MSQSKLKIDVSWHQLGTGECLRDGVWCVGTEEDKHVPAVSKLCKSLNFVHGLSEKLCISSAVSYAFLPTTYTKPSDCYRAHHQCSSELLMTFSCTSPLKTFVRKCTYCQKHFAHSVCQKKKKNRKKLVFAAQEIKKI